MSPRTKRLGALAFVAFLLCLAFGHFINGLGEPRYQGRKISQWLRLHPREYVPAVQAMGPKAVPFAIAELSISDSGLSRWGERTLAKMSLGPFWTTARQHRYYAGLALQILDTNATPALLDTVFKSPLRYLDDSPGWQAASALGRMDTVNSRALVEERVLREMQSLTTDARTKACLILTAGLHPTAKETEALEGLTRDPKPSVRGAALLALTVPLPRSPALVAALIERLSDERPANRWLAITAVAAQGPNADSALPVLLAISREDWTKKSVTDDLEGLFVSPTAAFGNQMPDMLQHAIHSVQPPPTSTSSRR